MGGLGMDFTYKQLRITTFFTIKKQIGTNAYAATATPGTVKNQSTAIFGKQWQQPGDIASVARFTTLSSYSMAVFTGFSDGIYTDASYIRLSNLSIAYSLPVGYIKKIGMQNCNIFLHANNLFVITGYKGLDPEIHSFGVLPPVRTIVGGLSFSF
jgi:hypothetical protein